MDSHTTLLCGRTLKRHSVRRQYQRLGVVCAKKDKSSSKAISETRNKYSKIIRSASKTRSNVITAPKPDGNLVKRLRDSYVDMMICLAGNIVQFNNGNVFLAQRIPRSPQFST
ncbi:hypothetical protein CsSME_00006505 [Camellia sinensis var. sinensis]